MLVILDGWGWRDDPADNAIRQARTPTFDRLWQDGPHGFLHTSRNDVGLPGGRPALVAKRKGTLVHAYASWNGATQIARWQLLSGNAADSLAPAGAPVPFADLETSITATTAAPYVAVQALDSAGKPLGQSAAVRVGP